MRNLQAIVAALCLLLASIAAAQKPPALPDDEAFRAKLILGVLELEGGAIDAARTTLAAAVAMRPTDHHASLALAIALMGAGELDRVEELAKVAFSHADTYASSRYVVGCLFMTRKEYARAVETLQQVADAEPAITAVRFQIALAYERLGRMEEALAELRAVIELDRDHPAAYYIVAQIKARMNKDDEAEINLKEHRRILNARLPRAGPPLTRELLAACRLLLPSLPQVQSRPSATGVPVRFALSTTAILGESAAQHGAPIAFVDLGRDGRLDLFARVLAGGYRVLAQGDGGFTAEMAPIAANAPASARPARRALAADLGSDDIADILLIGEDGLQALAFARDGSITDVTQVAGLRGASGKDGVLVDLDHTGSLDLALIGGDGRIAIYRNHGKMSFAETTSEFFKDGAPPLASQLTFGDIDGDDTIDLLVAREDHEPAALLNMRRGRLKTATLPPTTGRGIAVFAEDLDGDLLMDVVVNQRSPGAIPLSGTLAGDEPLEFIVEEGVAMRGGEAITRLIGADFDNDGFVDLIAGGESLRAWRNLGGGRFAEVTAALGLDQVPAGEIADLLAGDLDGDGDTDIVFARSVGGLEVLRNEGGNANRQLSLWFSGRRSNSSGLGVRVEIFDCGYRAARTVRSLPLEIGLGERDSFAIINLVWADQTNQMLDVPASGGGIVTVTEPYTETGSCPYLYAWDGERFRFVTDILGVSPLGLPLHSGLFVPADPEEIVWIGSAAATPLRDGQIELRVTEELREVLYLDEVALLVADHAPGTEVHSTDKLRPPPFAQSELVLLGARVALSAARDSRGVDVRARVAEIDGVFVSPPAIRGDHLRGLADLHSIEVDFAAPAAAPARPTLALSGWLRYGGATGNMAAAHDATLPMPAPRLAMMGPDGKWEELDVVVGMPAGKTKTIVVELPPLPMTNAISLRLTTAFEIHWDRIALFDRLADEQMVVKRVAATSAELRAHGYGEIEPHEAWEPLSNSYDRLRAAPPWRWTPGGYYTRYGAVGDLIGATDDRLAVMGGGDEIALAFSHDHIPECAADHVRDYFFYSVGWDKDADYHCELGLDVLPLPFHGMDDQLYGVEARPMHLPVEWIAETLTRKVESRVPGTRTFEMARGRR